LAFVSILSIIILIKIYIDYNNINSKALIEEEEEETLNKKELSVDKNIENTDVKINLK